MNFGKPRFNKKYDWELLRYCTKKYTTVVGGASRLFDFFKRNYAGSIISYCDLRYSTGQLYQLLKMKLLHQSAPNYFYTKDCIVLESRNKYQKHKLVKLLSNFDPNLTEAQNMFNNGYRRIWDCGNLVYVFDNTTQPTSEVGPVDRDCDQNMHKPDLKTLPTS
jgi:hypothetical protein